MKKKLQFVIKRLSVAGIFFLLTLNVHAYTPPTALQVPWAGTDQTSTCHQYGDYITNVTFAGINNTTAGSGAKAWHSDYGRTTPQVTPGEVTMGQSYSISVTVTGQTFLYQYLAVYIDWNQNNINGTSSYPWVLDTNENPVVWSNYTGSGTKTLTGTITIPTGINPGQIYMRVMLDGDSGGSDGGNYVCAIGSGEFHDYVLNVTSNSPLPTITGISPTSGPTAGGTSVVITGTNLTAPSVVKFGSTNATSYTVNSATQITAVSPAGSAGAVDVTVTTTFGTSATRTADQFTFVAAPTITAISPTGGPIAGGKSVIITGTNLTAASSVKFGSTNATSYTVNSATQITAVSPAGSAGAVDVTVTTAGGTSATSSADQFTYVAPPTISALSPYNGPIAGGTSVVITGTNLTTASAVKFGSTNATSYTVNSATQITAVSPAGSAGVVDVTVTTTGGTSATIPPDQFIYVAAPIVTTTAVSSITSTGVTLNGTVNPKNATTAVTFDYGLTTSYGTNVTATQSPLSGTSATPVTILISGLVPNTTYHYRVNAVNAGGTTNGTDLTFTTSAALATATTLAATVVTSTGATLNGGINPKNATTVVTFEYGLSTSYGTSVTATQSPVTGTTTSAVSYVLTGLVPNTTYHFRVNGVNAAGTINGSDLTFTTSAAVPTATTLAASSITNTGATLNGSVNAKNASTVITFEYGLTTAYGTTVTATQSPLTGTTTTAVSYVLSGLNANTTYHFRVNGVNTAGTTNGADLTFSTLVTELENTTTNRISLSPNPATDGFTINVGEKISTIEIYNLSGELVLTEQVTGKTYINISKLQSGAYVVKANKLISKLIKK